MKRKKTKMNYETAEALFNNMDILETNSKLYSSEIYNAEPDWDEITRFSKNIQKARKDIFTMLQGHQDV
jgi:uncharacterized LabA/DUF88 family protein|tara:strand:- start:2175 stop:2381 length:207 start_codon:yes stop_codon:yes gene_type:complete